VDVTITKERWAHIKPYLHVNDYDAPAGVVIAVEALTNGDEIIASWPSWTFEEATTWTVWIVTQKGLLAHAEVRYDREWHDQANEMQHRISPSSQTGWARPLNTAIRIEYGQLVELNFGQDWFCRGPLKLTFPDETITVPSEQGFKNITERFFIDTFTQAVRNGVGF
jgi:hypothetical protein